eukprot:15469166-Alexandrium_andersonii.AAC.1
MAPPVRPLAPEARYPPRSTLICHDQSLICHERSIRVSPAPRPGARQPPSHWDTSSRGCPQISPNAL